MSNTSGRIKASTRELADRAIRFAVRSAEAERHRAAGRQATVPTSTSASPPEPRPERPDATPPTVDPAATRWSRSEVFGDKWTRRHVSEFVDRVPPVAWIEENPDANLEPEEIHQWILAQAKWRFHHGLDGLDASPGFYRAYSARVEALLDMVTRALSIGEIDVSASSFVDLGATEGYVANHLNDAGATDIDCCELNELNVERMWKVRAATGRSYGRVGRIDLNHVDWASHLGRSYDVAVALGVVYHMENPLLFCRNLRALAPVALIESDTPVFNDNQRFRGHGSLYMHRDQVTIGPGDVHYLMELRPDRHALVELLLQAGFGTVQLVPSPPMSTTRYFASGEKTLLIASSSDQ